MTEARDGGGVELGARMVNLAERIAAFRELSHTCIACHTRLGTATGLVILDEFWYARAGLGERKEIDPQAALVAVCLVCLSRADLNTLEDEAVAEEVLRQRVRGIPWHVTGGD